MTTNSTTDSTTTGAAAVDGELPSTLPELGAYLVRQLHEHDFPRHSQQHEEEQALALAEEAGAFVGAYRRVARLARPAGTWKRVEATLAEVITTTYTLAHLLDFNVGLNLSLSPLSDATAQDENYAVLGVSNAVGNFIDAYTDTVARETPRCYGALVNILYAALSAASMLRIDLPAAVRANIAQAAARGWGKERVPLPGHEGGGRAMTLAARLGQDLPQPLTPKELHALADRASHRLREPLATGAEVLSLVRNVCDLDAAAASLGQVIGHTRVEARELIRSEDPQAIAAGWKLLAISHGEPSRR